MSTSLGACRFKWPTNLPLLRAGTAPGTIRIYSEWIDPANNTLLWEGTEEELKALREILKRYENANPQL